MLELIEDAVDGSCAAASSGKSQSSFHVKGVTPSFPRQLPSRACCFCRYRGPSYLIITHCITGMPGTGIGSRGSLKICGLNAHSVAHAGMQMFS
mmetsp:Transcript_14703/g.41384  ORF Transcript_14703/g.41384 Transcript_14703/m.41384 type:complete len:94 (-) Transcript_14703:575-856(-)